MMIPNLKLRIARAKIRRGDGYIYVAAVDDGAVIKIGFSLDPETRVQAMRDRKVRLMGYFPCTLRQERLFHGRLKDFRVSNQHFFSECYPRAAIGTEAFAEALRTAPKPVGHDDHLILAIETSPTPASEAA